MRRFSLLILCLGIVSSVVAYNFQASVHQKALRSRQIGTETQLLSRIFNDYDPNTRPPVRDSAQHSAIVVIASVYINRVTWGPDHATVDLYLRQQYEDSRLSYEVDAREGLEEISVPPTKDVWKPDTYFTTAEEVTKESKGRQRIVVEPSGHVRISENRQIIVPIDNGDSFPFVNKRTINLRLSSYTYDIDDVVYLWANSPPTVVPVEVAKELLDGPYAFAEAFAGDCVGNYTVGVHSCVDVTVIFEGPTSDTFLRVFLPAILLVIASWFHFFVHGSWSVPRSFSAAAPFLIFAGLHVFSPAIASHSSALRVFLLGCLVFTFASFLEYFIVICGGVHRRVTHYQTSAYGARDGSAEPLSTVVTNQPIDNEVVEKPGKCTNFTSNNGIDVISRVLFPVAFLLFLIVFLILYIV
uniref:Neur_chan_LBD domain-containing protein n=1 Tax=Panagrellus redivivus TaxID=6233 RepID=A0A7E4VDU8_PANRE